MAKSMIRKTAGRQQTFSLDAPEATQVQLVGEFTRWTERPLDMEKDLEGVWWVKVTLEQGRHCYRFIADGEWRDDPACPVRESNPYGSENAVRLVT
jgi:1,4-alpha-glucan branching enzyme